MKCARTSCTNTDANCQHIQTQLLYCIVCARKINANNPGMVVIPYPKMVAQPQSSKAATEG